MRGTRRGQTRVLGRVAARAAGRVRIRPGSLQSAEDIAPGARRELKLCSRAFSNATARVTSIAQLNTIQQ